MSQNKKKELCLEVDVIDFECVGEKTNSYDRLKSSLEKNKHRYRVAHKDPDTFRRFISHSF